MVNKTDAEGWNHYNNITGAVGMAALSNLLYALELAT